jgi:hypothetical protein
MGRIASCVRSRFNAGMTDTRTTWQLEAQGYPWIGCECCKGTVWVPFKMIRQKIPMLSSWTLDELAARMKCDQCGDLLLDTAECSCNSFHDCTCP